MGLVERRFLGVMLMKLYVTFDVMNNITQFSHDPQNAMA